MSRRWSPGPWTSPGKPASRSPATKAGPGTAIPSACLPGVGRLLAVLAAGCHGGRIGEIGTGAGVGSAWLASAMPRDCLLVTVEIDGERAAQAARLLAGDGRVRVLTGDGDQVMRQDSPFDLLFADGGAPDPARYAALVDLLRVGGQIVMDDVTPLASGRRRTRRAMTSSGSSSSAIPG